MKLLLVEDDPMVGGLLETALREAGYNVELCPDAECAELAMKVQSFDVVVLDIGLPDKSGLDFEIAATRAIGNAGSNPVRAVRPAGPRTWARSRRRRLHGEAFRPR